MSFENQSIRNVRNYFGPRATNKAMGVSPADRDNLKQIVIGVNNGVVDIPTGDAGIRIPKGAVGVRIISSFAPAAGTLVLTDGASSATTVLTLTATSSGWTTAVIAGNTTKDVLAKAASTVSAVASKTGTITVEYMTTDGNEKVV